MRRIALVLVLAAGAPARAQDDREPVVAEPELPRPAGDRPPADDAAGDADEARRAEVDGYVSTFARFENAADESVLRFFTDVSADAAWAGDHPVTLRLYGRGVWTAAGDPEPGDLLYGAWDTYDGAVQGRLYEAFARIDRLGGEHGSGTIGRQFIDEGVYLQFDGVRFDQRLPHLAPDLELSLYGGAGVEYAEASGDEHWLAGLVVRGSVPSWRTRWRAQYVHVDQSFAGINDPPTDPAVDPVVYPAQTLHDDLVGVSLWQPVGDSTQLFGRFTLLNGYANEIHARARWHTKDARWVVFVDYYQLFQRLFNVTNDLSPFVPMLGSLDPFLRLSARATWRPDDTLVLEAGASFRRLEDENDEGPFNHDWVHFYAAATFLEVVRERVDLTFTANGYRTSADEYTALTSNADVRLRDDLRLAAGIDYSLYKYDWFSNTEREDVWTYRADLHWDISDDLRGTVGVAVDDDRVTTWTTVVARLTWRF